jgi:hypothetical protein
MEQDSESKAVRIEEERRGWPWCMYRRLVVPSHRRRGAMQLRQPNQLKPQTAPWTNAASASQRPDESRLRLFACSKSPVDD